MDVVVALTDRSPLYARSSAVLSSKTMDEVELEDSGRGLICKDPINMGNALFQLPLKIVIDKEKALEVRARVKTKVARYYSAILCPSAADRRTQPTPRKLTDDTRMLSPPPTMYVQEFGSALPADINEYFAVALMLIKQKSLGERSFWCVR